MRDKKWNKRLVEIADKLKAALSLAAPAQRLGSLLGVRENIYDRLMPVPLKMRVNLDRVVPTIGAVAGVIGAGLSAFFLGPSLLMPMIFGASLLASMAALEFVNPPPLDPEQQTDLYPEERYEMSLPSITERDVRADKVQRVVNTLDTEIKKTVQGSPEVLKDTSLRTRFRAIFPSDLPAANDEEKTEEVFAKAKLSLHK